MQFYTFPMGESTLTPPEFRGVYVNLSIINERGSNKNKPSIELRAISFQLHLTEVTKGLWDCFKVNLSSAGSLRLMKEVNAVPMDEITYTSQSSNSNLYMHPYLTPTLNLNTRTLLEQTPSVNTPPINVLRWTRVIWLLILNNHLYTSGMWLGVAPKMNTKKTCVEKRLNHVLKIW